MLNRVIQKTHHLQCVALKVILNFNILLGIRREGMRNHMWVQALKQYTSFLFTISCPKCTPVALEDNRRQEM